MLFATVALAELRVAAELLSCTGCHICRRASAAVRFSAGIRGSSQPARPNPSGVDRDCGATSGQASFATLLETPKILEAAGARQPKVQRLSEESKVLHRANKFLNGYPSFHGQVVRGWQTVRQRVLLRACVNPPPGAGNSV